MHVSLSGTIFTILWITSSAAGPLAAQQGDRATPGQQVAQRGQEQQERRNATGQLDPVIRQRDSRLADPRLLLPQPDHMRQWYLGVEVTYRDTGAQITRVERHSPAQRAGLEARDVIVTVAGYQVGRVTERLYPLDRELELRADRQGRVTLLVHNHRNGQLTPLPVRLERAERRRNPIDAHPLIGTISSRRIASLPANAVLTVRLLDVTNRHLPLRVVARRTYRDLGPLPLPFELVCEQDDIVSGHEYALEAEVTVNGSTAYRSPDRYPVFARKQQGRVDMVLEPVRR